MMHIKLYYDIAFLVKCILVCWGHSYFMTNTWGVGSNGAYINYIMTFMALRGDTHNHHITKQLLAIASICLAQRHSLHPNFLPSWRRFCEEEAEDGRRE